MYLDSKVVKSTSASTAPILGAPLTNTPKHSVTMWMTYDLPWGIQVGAGGQYLSSRLARNTAPIEKVPGYTTIDAMVKYQVTEKVSLQANLYNITDKYYLDQLHPSHVIPGAGRTALFTANVKY
jgi:catecholate siderophore receptor